MPENVMSANVFCAGKKTDELGHRAFVEGTAIASDTTDVKYPVTFRIDFRVNECD
jgi:hypothetical protein